MKMLTAMRLAAPLWAALALAQTRQVTLVKNFPTNYGTNGFDISWADNSTQKYYLADRTNNAIDLVDAATDTFLGFIGKGQYTGTKPCPGQPKDLRHCAGPNGVVTDDQGHVWAGDGAGNIIEADASETGEKALRNRPAGGGALAFVDSSGKQSGEIVVDAHPESFQLGKNGTRVFINLPDKKEVQVADVVNGTTVGRWPTTAATTCFPMALDEAHQRLFLGCRTPARLLVLDTASGKTVASPEVVADTDDIFYDAARSRVYVIGGQGFIDQLQRRTPIITTGWRATLYRRAREPAFSSPTGTAVRCSAPPGPARIRDPGVRAEVKFSSPRTESFTLSTRRPPLKQNRNSISSASLFTSTHSPRARFSLP